MLPVVFAAAALTGCGGGSDRDDHRPPPPPPPVACASQTSHGDGFAIGSCASTMTNVFQPIEPAVAIAGADSYTGTLVFPPALQSLGGSASFTLENKSPETRNIIGVLRGQAYENPPQSATLAPPYVALTDFFVARNYRDDPTGTPLLALNYASFGTWERFAGSDFNEGYLGGWYAQRPASTSTLGPTTSARYTGQVVGIIGPDGQASPPALNGRFGFSGPITIDVAGTGIQSATIGQLRVTFRRGADPDVTEEELALRSIALTPSNGTAPATISGFLQDGGGGQPGDASATSGAYEAQFFGAMGHDGDEMAGRFRFRTSNGLVAVGSFGAQRPVP